MTGTAVRSGDGHYKETPHWRGLFSDGRPELGFLMPQAVLAHVQGELPEIVAAFRQDIEGTQLHLVIVQAGMQGIEIGDAVNAQDHRLAVEHEALQADLPNANSHNSAFGTLPGKGRCLFTNCCGRLLLLESDEQDKPATASKRGRGRKIVARTQRTKQAVVKSAKNNPLRAAAGSIESLHDNPKQEALIIEDRTPLLQDDSGQVIRGNDPRKGSDSLAMVYVQAYQAKLLEIVQANMQFAFDFAQSLAAVRSPFESFAVIAEFTSKRIELFLKHSKDMAELNIRQLVVQDR
jgi:Phasin protein